jgi:raffinose/stachyose/melibiose transport system substrate-binding protein
MEITMKKSFPLSLICVLMVATVFLSACQPAAPAVPTSAPAEVATVPAVVEPTSTQPAVEQATSAPVTAEEITLNYWSEESQASPYGMKIEEMTRKFEAAHPGVKVVITYMTMDDLNKTVPLALNQPDGPDVAEVNNGYSVMGSVVKAGLLLPLEPYVQKYGWDKLISPGLLARMSFTPDGKEFGKGNLYGMALSAEIVGVYYNKKIFADNNVSVPKTFQEYEADLKLFKDKGIVPIAMAAVGSDSSIAVQAPEAILHLLTNRQWLDDFAFGRPNVSYNTPESIKAAEIFQNWGKAGYFYPGYEGIGGQDMAGIFAQGGIATMIAGNWWSSTIIDVAPNQFGFFVLPSFAGNPPALSIGGLGFPHSISAHSKHPDLAAEYINTLISQEAADAYASVGQLPSRSISDAQKTNVDPLLADIIAAFDNQNKNDLIGQYLDWAGPNMWDAATAATQELLANKITPAEFAAQIEKTHATDVSVRLAQ